MRLKFLLFVFLLSGGAINAQNYHHQDTVDYLIITEYRGDNTHLTYLELTNMSDEPVQLGQFKIGWVYAGMKLDLVTGKTYEGRDLQDYWIPLDTLLPAGESFVFASADNYNPLQYAKGLEGYSEKMNQDKMLEYADFIVHLPEGPLGQADSTDLVTEGLSEAFGKQWGPGMNGFYIEQHLAYGAGDNIVYDSIVVDQVGGMFIDDNSTHPPRSYGNGFDVAGVTEATATAYLIRRHDVKTGNLDFNNARGVGLDDSEWIPIPHHGGAWRDPLWTVGNHDDYNLDENTLESDEIEVDFENKTLYVPWGVRRGDDIMNYFVKKPGIGWEYVMGSEADSLTHAVQTGDQLFIYVCGDDLDFASFDIEVKEPAANANMVVPVANNLPESADDAENYEIETGQWGWPRITKHDSGNDTIWGTRGGIPFATPVDTLLMDRLEKPSNAAWEIVFASGVQSPYLEHGDKLKVTAQDGSVKDYFISVHDYRANTDAKLSAIQWPDIPEFYKGLFGWIGDTIPGFGPEVYNYNVEVPLVAEGIPALVTHKSDPNAKVDVDRATSLSAGTEQRTVTYTVTAEDDTTINNYSITFAKQKDPAKLQPYKAEPFISEVVSNNRWAGNNGFVEICNPGNQPLNLNDYMIVGGYTPNPADLIAETNEGDWLARYQKFIPGLKWAASQAEWVIQPNLAQVDLAVDPIVQPGDVFVIGAINRGHNSWCDDDYAFPGYYQVDVQLINADIGCYMIENPWGEEVGANTTAVDHHRRGHIFLLKIDNDSVKQGLKPATDPNDFTVIDAFGMGETTVWVIDGNKLNPTPNVMRKPEYTEGNPVPGASFGVNDPAETEWNAYTHKLWNDLGYGGNESHRQGLADLGKHFFIAPTHYRSTVSSKVYKVSEGYQSEPPEGPQTIKGITTGTNVSDFFDNLIKADSLQTLMVTSGGTKLGMADLLSNNDELSVTSADSSNTTLYVLNVTEEGLSSNAVLTSNRYDITIQQQPAAVGDGENAADSHLGTGEITGFEYGTAIQTIVNNVTVPENASMSVVSANGGYVPYKILNYDTVYVTTTVNDDTYFEVIAEDGVTTITYQLLPQSSESSAFVVSDLYDIEQIDLLIQYVPRGTNIQTFLSNLTPSRGASIKVIDKYGLERTFGPLGDDDRLLATSGDGTVTTVYHISWLPTEDTQQTLFTAYILSNAYSIDQVDYKIHGASGTVDINDFYSRIKAAAGATAVVVDENGAEKTSGDIDRTDVVQVTSADGKIEVIYTFGSLVDANEFRVQNQIEIYPNPTSRILNASGVEKGQRIQVYNTVGTAVLDIKVNSNREVIPLQNEPAGMYLIVVSEENQLIGRYKAIKK